jgi:hypothetical protein
MSISPPACPPLPTLDELLTHYEEVPIESLQPQEIVIVYSPNSNPDGQISCMQILENPSSPGRIRYRRFNQVQGNTESLITHLVSNGIRYFKRDDTYENFNKFLDEQKTFNEKNDRTLDTKNKSFDILGKHISSFLKQPLPNPPGGVRGGKKYKRTNRTKKFKKKNIKKNKKTQKKKTRYFRIKK